MKDSEKYIALAAILVIVIVVIYMWHRHGQKATFAQGAAGGHPRFGAGASRRGSRQAAAHLASLGAAAGQPRFGAGVSRRA